VPDAGSVFPFSRYGFDLNPFKPYTSNGRNFGIFYLFSPSIFVAPMVFIRPETAVTGGAQSKIAIVNTAGDV